MRQNRLAFQEPLDAIGRQVFRPGMTSIVLIGRVRPEEARAAVEKYFGGWAAVGPKPETDLPPVPLNPPAATVVPDARRVRDEVTLAQTLGLTRFHPDYYALRLGNQVLSGAAFASRLFRALREQSGPVYSAGLTLEAGKNRAAFAVRDLPLGEPLPAAQRSLAIAAAEVQVAPGDFVQVTVGPSLG